MRKGQLLSQPFFYIFAIVVIGLILIFGFFYVNKILKTGCEVEGLDFINDAQAKVNEINALSFGSSFECSLVRSGGSSNRRCELVIPENINGVCFIDTTKSFNENDILFSDIKELVVGLGSSANRNLFFSLNENSNCKTEPAMIKKMTTDGAVCLDVKKGNQNFIMENIGSGVVIKNI